MKLGFCCAVVAVACAGAVAALGALLGCAAPVPVADQTLAAHPKAWVAVPQSVRATPAFAALLAARKREYATEVVEYDPAVGTPAQRLALVQSTLRRVGQDATSKRWLRAAGGQPGRAAHGVALPGRGGHRAH